GGSPPAPRRRALRVPHRQGATGRDRGRPAPGRQPLPDEAVRARRAARRGEQHPGSVSARRPIPLPGSRPAPAPPARTLEELEEDRERLEATVRALRGALRVVENVSSAFQRERILAAVTDALTRSLGAAAARVWLVGVVAMWSRGRMRDEVIEALRILARHAATAIAGAQLIQDVRAESEKSQAATRQIEALVQASRSGILLVDRHSRVAFVNSAFRRLFALDEHELTGWPVAAVEASVRPVLGNQALRGEDRELEVQLPGEAKPRVLRAYS